MIVHMASMILSVVAATTVLLHGANAHGYISEPKPEFLPHSNYTAYSALITAADTNITAFQGRIFNNTPENNTQVFTEAFIESGLTSLRSLIDKFVPGCGNTVVTTTPRDTATLTAMKFQNDQHQEGFSATHHGPCEVWIDNLHVFTDNDCTAHYRTYPAVVPVDFSKCKSKLCYLRFYWLALHEPQWQAYKQCVPIKYGESHDEWTPRNGTSEATRNSTNTVVNSRA